MIDLKPPPHRDQYGREIPFEFKLIDGRLIYGFPVVSSQEGEGHFSISNFKQITSIEDWINNKISMSEVKNMKSIELDSDQVESFRTYDNYCSFK